MNIVLSPIYDDIKKEYKYGYKSPFNIILSLMLTMFLLSIWIESCVLIYYNKRVRYYCQNNTVRTIRNEFSQPLV